ncbi:lantibiotic immunity ABC transporter MutE/EpiE family permease subunit [Streptococcus merionis]|uniref:Lantibiotic transport permease n=1 Tax=Streptococcus merionis TaxID=400065 RepID=A0A239SNJ0_9STRE|nr:lantibiotic immunity ABC transporter MutE/EpiE family permease subunit [Streptococcus merionis]SNU86957.1 lantibiotic transport permease [Streptococcus merionis]
MTKIILSNLLKIKNTSIYKLVFLFPIICIMLSLLFSALGGESILRLTAETTLNQWGIIWINVIISVNSGLLNKLEKDSNKYSIFLSRDVDLKKVEYTRVILIAFINLTISIILGLMLVVVSLVIPTPSITSLGRILLTILLLWLTTLWQIPLTLWLSRKTNLYFVMIINTISPLIIGTSFSLLDKWYLFPYDWSMKLLEPMTGMRINGIPFGSDFIPDYSLVFISLSLGIFFFILLTELAAISFKRQVR